MGCGRKGIRNKCDDCTGPQVDGMACSGLVIERNDDAIREVDASPEAVNSLGYVKRGILRFLLDFGSCSAVDTRKIQVGRILCHVHGGLCGSTALGSASLFLGCNLRKPPRPLVVAVRRGGESVPFEGNSAGTKKHKKIADARSYQEIRAHHHFRGAFSQSNRLFGYLNRLSRFQAASSSDYTYDTLLNQ